MKFSSFLSMCIQFFNELPSYFNYDECVNIFGEWYTKNKFKFLNADPKSTPIGSPGFEIGRKGGYPALFDKAVAISRPFMRVDDTKWLLREYDNRRSTYFIDNIIAASDCAMKEEISIEEIVKSQDEKRVPIAKKVTDYSSVN